MDNDTSERLRRIRGAGVAKRHNARTVAALAGNPGCVRRAVLDAAGVDKDKLARHVGYPAKFGQSQFAITRGNSFEAQVKANGFAELIKLLRETLELDLPEVGQTDLEDVGGHTIQEIRHTRSRQLLTRAAADGGSTFFDHPLLTLDVGGNLVYLEPDLVAFHHNGKFHVVEIKSFAVIDEQPTGARSRPQRSSPPSMSWRCAGCWATTMPSPTRSCWSAPRTSPVRRSPPKSTSASSSSCSITSYPG
ncbi:hypothetical protein [Actinoplanes sp. NPDC026623]|uniref:hypothetical protein n=1 Tax=Actinoplanes sp. NPDC026623 TaxID=3155610 RepID=UPI0033D735E2